MKIQNFSPPKNETWEHFLLKNVALAFLRINLHCNIAATEVDGMFDAENVVNHQRHNYIADAVGIKVKNHFIAPHKRIDPNEIYRTVETMYCIEVKVSQSDFKSGYCVGGDLNYIMAPKGLINPDELYKNVGLIEVDVNNLKFDKWQLYGVEIVKKATKIKRERIDYRRSRTHHIYQHLATQLTLNAIRQNPYFYLGYGLDE